MGRLFLHAATSLIRWADIPSGTTNFWMSSDWSWERTSDTVKHWIVKVHRNKYSCSLLFRNNSNSTKKLLIESNKRFPRSLGYMVLGLPTIWLTACHRSDGEWGLYFILPKIPLKYSNFICIFSLFFKIQYSAQNHLGLWCTLHVSWLYLYCYKYFWCEPRCRSSRALAIHFLNRSILVKTIILLLL